MIRICKNTSCGAKFNAKPANVKRGWALYCSKRCKAIVQERRTGQCATYYYKKRTSDDEEGTFSNAHQFSNEE